MAPARSSFFLAVLPALFLAGTVGAAEPVSYPQVVAQTAGMVADAEAHAWRPSMACKSSTSPGRIPAVQGFCSGSQHQRHDHSGATKMPER